jgi:Domain of unknown function (DUF4333)
VRRGRAIALVGVLALAGACTRTKTLDGQQLDAKIASDMQSNLGIQGASVSCPDDVSVEAGGTFDCTATSPDGGTMTLEVTQSDDQGHVTYKVVGAG